MPYMTVCNVMVCLSQKALREEFLKPTVPWPQVRVMFQDLMMLILDDVNKFLECLKPKVPQPQETLMFQDLMMLILGDVNTFLESPAPLPSDLRSSLSTDLWLPFEFRLLMMSSPSFHFTRQLQHHPDP